MVIAEGSTVWVVRCTCQRHGEAIEQWLLWVPGVVESFETPDVARVRVLRADFGPDDVGHRCDSLVLVRSVTSLFGRDPWQDGADMPGLNPNVSGSVSSLVVGGVR